MHVFVTGANGWIGSATVAELLRRGHRVVGAARTADGQAVIEALGAESVAGRLEDPAALVAAAGPADAVVHLAYQHDFGDLAEAARRDLDVITAFGDALAGSGRALLIASGTAGLAPGRVATEDDRPETGWHPRAANADVALALAARDVRAVVVRFAPTVHGAGDHGFVARLVEVARERGVSGYIGEGTNRWSAVHRADAAALVALAVAQAPAGGVLHAVAEEGVPTRTIAEAIGRALGLPVVSVPADQAPEHFGWIAGFFAADAAASSAATRALLGWEPTGATLLEDLDGGAYT